MSISKVSIDKIREEVHMYIELDKIEIGNDIFSSILKSTF